MKTNTFFAAAVTLVALAVPALALDGGNSARQGSLFNGESGDRVEALYEGGPHIFSIGAYSQYQKRGMDDGRGSTDDWTVHHLVTYIGCDVLPWMTLEGGIGQSKLGNLGDDRSSDVEWMGGVRLRILDYMLIEPIIGEDTYWFGLDSHVQFTGSESDGSKGDIKWGELFGSLTMSLTSRPERYGFMDRISIFFGPAFSLIEGTKDGKDISEDQAVGFVGGLQFVPSDNITIKVEAQQFDQTSLGVSLGFHF
jgi:hypothetical protein